MNNQLSPAPTVDVLMSFPEAIAELTAGKKIARIEWHNQDYGLLKDGIVCIFRMGEFFTWKVSDRDLLAKDWIIIG